MTLTRQQEQQQNHDCARLAREALFPSRGRLLRANANHNANFPALLMLDRYRQQLLRNCSSSLAQDQQPPITAISNVFPRRVVVVRNVTSSNNNENCGEEVQWNGQPDISHQQEQQHDASFEVVPNRLTVRCTSKCDELLQNSLQRAFVQRSSSKKGGIVHQEIVVCSDRVLQGDYYNNQHPLRVPDSCSGTTINTDAKNLPRRSLAAVEEVLAHELVVVEQQANNNNQDLGTPLSAAAAAAIQVQAAQAAECYYYSSSRSRHEESERQQQQQQQAPAPVVVKRGSQLGTTGFSLLPRGIQTWMQRQCIQRVATEHLLLLLLAEQPANHNNATRTSSSRREAAQKAVQDAMKHQGADGAAL
jgi:hypothetical protein